jgi:hypothetical protein
MRVHKRFKAFIEEMTNQKPELSGIKATELISRHKNAVELKQDIINYDLKQDKRGITFNLFYALGMILALILILGILAFVFNSMYSGLNQDVMLGNVNLSNITEGTFGVFVDSYNNNLDLYGLFVIFGTIIGLFLASFIMRGKWDKLLIIVDILIMTIAYIFSVIISNTYETFLNASAGVITQFEGLMPKTSNFLLHLPRYVVVIGAVCMILFYTIIPKKEGEQSPGNYQEGQY